MNLNQSFVRWSSAALLAVSVVVQAQPLFAQAGASTSSESAAAARAQYRKAYEALNQKRWPEARRLLRELWSTTQTHDVASSLSQAEAALGNRAEAAQLLALAIARVPPKDPIGILNKYHAALAELRGQVGSVRITGMDRSAELRVDGNAVQLEPPSKEIFLEPGEHVIEARLDAERGVQRRALAVAGQSQDLSLESSGPAAAAEVSAPAPAPPPSAEQVDVGVPPVQPEPRGRTLVPVYVASGVAALGLGLGTAFGFGAKNSSADSEAAAKRVGRNGCADGTASPSDCDAARQALRDQRRYSTLANVGWITAALGASVAITWLVWPETKRSDATARASLAVTPSGAALGVTGAF